jgi:MOSC domain-containing protein YiiM
MARPAFVVAVSASQTHTFSKPARASIHLVRGLGVANDAHSGATVKHRSRVARNPAQPNLRQVHLMQRELFDELMPRGFALAPGQLGENITTAGIDLLALPQDTLLRVGATAVLRITGLRNPCHQLERFQQGLMAAVLERAPDGALLRKAGIMAVVEHGGDVCAGDAIEVQLPPHPPRPLEPV